MGKNILVSICIPAYNSEQWIKHAIESSLCQTWKNIEIIIVDDGSIDSTLSIARKYESKTLKVISQKNSGACAARNLALSVAQGEYIQWLDADDILHSEKIKSQLLKSELNPDSLVLHSGKWGSFYSRLKMTRFDHTPLWRDLTPKEWLLIHFNHGCFMTPSAWLVSRKLTMLAGPWNERLLKNQDGEYFIRVVSKSSLVKYHDNSITYYRKGNLDSVSNKHSVDILQSLSLANDLCIKTLLKFEDSNETRKAAVNLLNRFTDHYYFYSNKILSEDKQKVFDLGGSLTPPPNKIFYKIIKNILGVGVANIIKGYLWHSQIIIKKYYEKICGILLGDNI